MEADEAVLNEVLRKKTMCIAHPSLSRVVVYTRMCRGCLSVRVIARKLRITRADVYS
jgi:hypothetical protein